VGSVKMNDEEELVYSCPHCSELIDINLMIMPFLMNSHEINDLVVICPECGGLLKINWSIQPILEDKTKSLESFLEKKEEVKTQIMFEDPGLYQGET
jgi:hypothetical protein